VTMEARRNIAVGRQHGAVKINLEMAGLSLALMSVVASFFFGFLLGEDSIGGRVLISINFIGR
jgi:hypothetical protein